MSSSSAAYLFGAVAHFGEAEHLDLAQKVDVLLDLGDLDLLFLLALLLGLLVAVHAQKVQD